VETRSGPVEEPPESSSSESGYESSSSSTSEDGELASDSKFNELGRYSGSFDDGPYIDGVEYSNDGRLMFVRAVGASELLRIRKEVKSAKVLIALHHGTYWIGPKI